MSPGWLKGLGIGCIVSSAFLLVVAWEWYDSNARAVEAANRIMKVSPFVSESPFGGMMKGDQRRLRVEAGRASSEEVLATFRGTVRHLR